MADFASFQQQINELNETKRLIEEAEREVLEKDTIIEDLEKEVDWLKELASDIPVEEQIRVKLANVIKRYQQAAVHGSWDDFTNWCRRP